MTVSVEAASPTYEVGTTFERFRAHTDNPLGPFMATGVQFTAPDSGGSDLVYRYRLDFDSVVDLGVIVLSGAGWQNSAVQLQDSLGDELDTLFIDSSDNEFRSYRMNVGRTGSTFFIEETNADPTWRFRSFIDVTLADGRKPELAFGPINAPQPIASATFDGGNGHAYLLVQLPASDWETARTHVLTNYPGFDLATITSAQEQLFIDVLLKKNEAQLEWWLGGEQTLDAQDQPSDIWQWATEEQWTFDNWSDDEPASGANATHLALTSGDHVPNWRTQGDELSAINGYIAESRVAPNQLRAGGLGGTVIRTAKGLSNGQPISGTEAVVIARPSALSCGDQFIQLRQWNVDTGISKILHIYPSLDIGVPQELVLNVSSIDSYPNEFVFAVSGCGEPPLDVFFNGPATRNPDSAVHAIVTPSPATLPGYDTTTIVSFRDDIGDDRNFGSINFNELILEVSQVTDFGPAVVNSLPLAIDDQATTTTGVRISIDVLQNDEWLDDAPVLVSMVSSPDDGEELDHTPINGNAVVRSDNVVVYTPAPSFTGTDTLTYKVTDKDGDSTQATITIAVDAAGSPGEGSSGLAPPPEFPSAGGGGALSLLAIAGLTFLVFLRSRRPQNLRP